MIYKLFPDKDTVQVLEHFIVHEQFEQDIYDVAAAVGLDDANKARDICKNLAKFGILVEPKYAHFIINQASTLLDPLRALISRFNMLYARILTGQLV